MKNKKIKLLVFVASIALVSTAYAADYLCCGTKWGAGKDETIALLAKSGIKVEIKYPLENDTRTASLMFEENWRGGIAKVEYFISYDRLVGVTRKVPFKNYEDAKKFYELLVKDYNAAYKNKGSSSDSDGDYESFQSSWDAKNEARVWAGCCAADEAFEVNLRYSELGGE